MSTTVSSKRYAQAAFEIAREENALEEWQSDLRKIAELTQDSEFVSLLENPKPPFELKAKLMQERLGKVNPLALNLAYLLILKDRLKSAGQIADEYERLSDEHYGIRHAEITTAIPLDDANKKRLSHHLEAMIGKKVSVSFQVDPDVLGGFIARINDSLVDGSIRNRLQELKKSLVEARG